MAGPICWLAFRSVRCERSTMPHSEANARALPLTTVRPSLFLAFAANPGFPAKFVGISGNYYRDTQVLGILCLRDGKQSCPCRLTCGSPSAACSPGLWSG